MRLSGIIIVYQKNCMVGMYVINAEIMKSTKVQTLRAISLKCHVLGEQTGMKLSCIKPKSKVRGLSIEPRSSTG